MALIPPSFLNGVASLGVDNNEGKREWVGTGFFYGLFSHKIDDEQNAYHTLLVTNAHVLEGKKLIWMKLNRKNVDEGSEDFPLELRSNDDTPLYTKHSEADVAAMIINLALVKEMGFDIHVFFAPSHFATIDELKSRGTSEGDGVFLLGFPMNLVGAERHHVICRTGCIARVRDMFEEVSKTFMVDATVFPGNSGGPVFNKPTAAALSETKGQRRCRLIGIVTAYVPYRDVAISPQTGRARVVFEENSGLSVVLPVDVIHEVVNMAAGKLTSSPDPSSNHKADEVHP